MVQEIIERKNGKDRVTRTRILIRGKEVHLKFTMPIWIRLEDELCLMDDLYTMMHSKGRFDEDRIPKLVEIMSGGEITAKEVLAENDVGTMRALIDEIQKTVAQAVTMKEKKYDDNSVHDETLEEIEKKEAKAD